MLLVIDVTKGPFQSTPVPRQFTPPGIQTQTAECLVIGEITCNKLIVALNKVDLLPEDGRQSAIDKMRRRLLKTFQATKHAWRHRCVPLVITM